MSIEMLHPFRMLQYNLNRFPVNQGRQHFWGKGTVVKLCSSSILQQGPNTPLLLQAR